MSIGYVFWNSKEGRIRTAWRLLAQLVLMLGLVLAVQVVINNVVTAILSDPANAGPTAREIVGLAMQILGQVTLVASVAVVGRYLDRRPFRDFGLRFSGRWWADLGFGLALGAVLMAMIFAVELAAGWIEVTGFFVAPEGGISFFPGILLPLAGYVAVGIGEEIWSRGYLLTNLAEGFRGSRMGAAAAIVAATIISGGVFGLAHAMNANASVVSTFNLFLIAFLLALGYILTGELAISIGLHITWNFFQGNVFGLPVSGGASARSFIGTEQAGPQLWTGGAFGPEAGLLGIGALLVGSALILLWVRVQEGSAALEREIAEAPEGSPGPGEAVLEGRSQPARA
jgi:hypothetical protein